MLVVYFAIENQRARRVTKKMGMLAGNYFQTGGAIMKMFRILGALLISLMLMLTGCMKINITAGSGIETGKAARDGRLPACHLSGNYNHPNDCLCSAGNCDCPGDHKCVPGTS
jgi:hypothetical protein